MPTIDTAVGALAIPLVPGETDAAISDPTIDGLLSYFGAWLKAHLDPKLATMTRPPVADACPAANRYAFNPSKLVSRFSRPALFLWCSRTTSRQKTMMIDERVRELELMYVFDRLQTIVQLQTHRGLMGAVDATLARAASREAHSVYASGQNVRVVLGLSEFRYIGGQEGFLQENPDASIREAAAVAGTRRSVHALGKGSAETIQEGYPSFHASFRIAEEIGDDTAVDPTDVARDLLVTAKVGDGTGPGLDILQHILLAPPTEVDGE